MDGKAPKAQSKGNPEAVRVCWGTQGGFYGCKQVREAGIIEGEIAEVGGACHSAGH